MNIIKKSLAVVLSGVLLMGTAAPAFACETDVSSEKEEVIYVNLDAGGGVKEVYAVNIFSGGSVTDYGEYSSVKMLNTSDPISYSGDRVTFSTQADKAYYQGTLTSTQIPWEISIKYFMDGKEYTADEIAGKSGKLRIEFSVEENKEYRGDFYQNYALQASFTLNTEQCENISAPDATVANVGKNKQMTYTILPGRGIDTAITADAEEFTMDAVSVNGLKLNLEVEVDDESLMDKVRELMDASVQLDDGADSLDQGAGELKDGGAELLEGTDSLRGGISSLDNGIGTLQGGLSSVQKGLDSLSRQSGALVSGSGEVREALKKIQEGVDAASVPADALALLTESSGEIKQAIGQLSDGAATLQENLGYAQYKELLEKNGLNIDTLKLGNSLAALQIKQQIPELEKMAEELARIPGMEEKAAELKEQIGQLDLVITLLEGNNAAIGGTKEYLDGVSQSLPGLTGGLKELKEKYTVFDNSISQLVKTLSGMAGSLADLLEGVNELVEKYGELDDGIGAYTDGVAQIVAGYRQVIGGVTALAQGSKELAGGSQELYGGASALYDGISSLYGGTQELSGGTEELREQTGGMDTQVEDEIDSLLSSLSGGEEVTSFVSDKNTSVSSVQFVIQTEAVEMEEEAPSVQEQEETLSFWQKLCRLFGLY